MMRACLVHNGASSSGWVGEGQSLSRSVHQTQLCSMQCTLSCASRDVCSAPWAVCILLCALLRGLCAIQCAERRCANQTELLHKGASSCCTLTPSASVLHVWQSCNLATVQCTMLAHRLPIIFKFESSSLLCEPVALYAENIIP